MPVVWNTHCPFCGQDAVQCRRLCLCDPPGYHSPYGSMEELRCASCGWKQVGPLVTRSLSGSTEVGRFYGLEPESTLKLHPAMPGDMEPYGGDVSTGEPSLQELRERCFDFSALPIATGATSLDEALGGAEWQSVKHSWPSARVAARFGLLTHHQWYQELPTGEHIDFVQNRPVWLVTFSSYGTSIWPAFHSRPATYRRIVILDAVMGRQLMAYELP